MTIHLTTLLLIAFIYLLGLFFIAYSVEKGWISQKLAKNPIVFSLSFGILCSSWMFYGSTGMAYRYGIGYLAPYIGLCLSFIFFPLLYRPILSIVRTYKLGSIADLFAFRFRSKIAGLLSTFAILLAVLPFLTMQIQAVTDATLLLSGNTTGFSWMALCYCFLICIFTLLFGARTLSSTEKHPGLVVAIAFESILKLVILLFLSYYAIFHIFGGVSELNIWLSSSAFRLDNLQTLSPTPWFLMTLMFFIAPFVMPHMFQIGLKENRGSFQFKTAVWVAPIYIALMAATVLPILWGGKRNQPGAFEEFAIFGLGHESPLINLIAYTGGFAASTGIVIVAVLAMSSMMLNHFILPFYQPKNQTDIYDWILWTRRKLIIFTLFIAYLSYLLFGNIQNLSNLGFVAFIGTLQFLPGIIAILFWQRATKKGFISGLSLGMSIWILFSIAPLILEGLNNEAMELIFRKPMRFLTTDAWVKSATISLAINSIVFIAVSFFTKQTEDEKNAANACNANTIKRSLKRELKAQSPLEFIQQLSKPLGQVIAEREVETALKQLNYNIGEFRPFALQKLRDTIETNISGIMGRSAAQSIIKQHIPHKTEQEFPVQEELYFVERHLEGFNKQFTGLAAQLDQLRQYHRQTLIDLPLGVCSISDDNEIIMWNEAMTLISNIPSSNIVGYHVSQLNDPFDQLLSDFIIDSQNNKKCKVNINGQPKWLSLTKNKNIKNKHQFDGTIILVEDQTDTQMLEQELIHNERLASIGRLAAGVAHEIGNPITAIDSLAQELNYMADEEVSSDDLKLISSQIREQANRVNQIVQSLVNFSHSNDQSNASINQKHDIHTIIEQSIHFVELADKQADIQIINNNKLHLNIFCDSQKLTQVFINLLNNAKDASSDGQKIFIETHTDDFTVIIDIIDHGEGIIPEYLEQIFDPFFTTKSVGSGTGLGLSLAYGIIEEHSGHLSAHSPVLCDTLNNTNIGTRFTISLPLA
ncbi:ATP-binding protein [Marinicellulosiphila megalodicopiae]|uniref:ATP-binding protein n=1 Tax=Marinicellulosiphila megalodicopiae TaxID=2724896 RepID=UPI003BB12354